MAEKTPKAQTSRKAKSTPAVTRPTKRAKPARKTPAAKNAPVKRRAVVKRPSAAKPKSPKKTAKRRSRKLLNAAHIQEIFDRFHKIDPDPKGELESVNVFTFLVAVVLSAQSTDAGVNKATRALFKAADTPQKMFEIGELRLREYIKTIGLFRTKAKNVIALSQKLIKEHNSKVPRDRDLLETLPGVGRKTANVIMNVAYGEPTMAVDTHVLRISNRVGLSNGNTPIKVEKDLLKKIPKQYGVPAHHWLILHGRYLCKARKPECWRCPIADLCRFEDKIKAS